MTRFINCEVCKTEGRILRSNGGPDDIDCGICPACNGECTVEVDDEPITLQDLNDYECENCIGMIEHGCYCKAVGAVGPGGPLADADDYLGADEYFGMDWWNSLDKPQRQHWMREAGNTGRAVNAWTAYKHSVAVTSNKREAL